MYELGTFVEMKKPHACTIKSTGKKANRWEVVRMGADIKIRCSNCEHRYDFERKMKKVIEQLIVLINPILNDLSHQQRTDKTKKVLSVFCFYLSSSNLPSLTSLQPEASRDFTVSL